MKQPFCAPSEALHRVLDASAALPRPETEIVPLDEAGGRIAAGTLSARMDQPPFDRSPFDGYALHSADTASASRETPVTLPVTMKLYAGDAPASPLPAGCAARIMTGAPLPEGADCVCFSGFVLHAVRGKCLRYHDSQEICRDHHVFCVALT